MKDNLNVDDLNAWKNEYRALYASNTENKKRLYVTLNGGFEVEVNRVVILETMSSNLAVETFNNN